MKKKAWMVVIALLLMCLLLTACGGGEDVSTAGGADDGSGYADAPADGGPAVDDPAGEDPYSGEDGPDSDVPPEFDPTLIQQTGQDELWLRYGDNGLIGVYDMANDCWMTEPCFEMGAGYDESGLALVRKDGYYGYIDRAGNTAIGFMFADAKSFLKHGDEYYAVASVGANGENSYGLIDRSGNFLINPEHKEILLQDQHIMTVKAKGYGSYDTYGLYRYTGETVMPPDNTVLHILKNGYILAAPKRSADEYVRLDLFDANGNKLNGVPGDYMDWDYIIYYANGAFALHYILDRSTRPDRTCFYFVNEDLEFISDVQFMSDAKFNKLGVVVSQVDTRYSNQRWVAMDRSGTILCDLPEETNGQIYEYANEFCAYGKIYPGTQQTRSLYVYKTGELTEWGEVQPIEGTNYICVRDMNTQLWGMYDGDVLYPAVCNKISWKKTDAGYQFTMTRGAETIDYTPVN